MAPSFLKKTMVYLGLLDDEYDEYDEYDDQNNRRYDSSGSRADTRVSDGGTESEDQAQRPVGRIRTVPKDNGSPPSQSAPASVSPFPTSPNVRPMGGSESARVLVVAPSRFGDAKEIADCLKTNRPVIVNLQVADRDLQRRMIDFCSGVTYALSGEMEKVADEVFLLAPTNVKISDEERQRLQERGFGRG